MTLPVVDLFNGGDIQREDGIIVKERVRYLISLENFKSDTVQGYAFSFLLNLIDNGWMANEEVEERQRGSGSKC